jgi:hypothetical protein
VSRLGRTRSLRRERPIRCLLSPRVLISRARPEAPFTGAAAATCLRWLLPLKVGRLPGGRSSRGTGTGEAGEVGAIQAKLRYGEQAKGSAGEFRQARTTFTKVKIHLALPVNLAPYRACNSDITVRHDYKARTEACDQRFSGI